MKKIIPILLLSTSLVALASCGENKDTPEESFKITETEFQSLINKIQTVGCDITFTQEVRSNEKVIEEKQTSGLKLDIPSLEMEQLVYDDHMNIRYGAIIKNYQQYDYLDSKWAEGSKYEKEEVQKIIDNQIDGLMEYFFPVTDFKQFVFNENEGKYRLNGKHHVDSEDMDFDLDYTYVFKKDQIVSISGSMSAQVSEMGLVTSVISTTSFGVGTTRIVLPELHTHSFTNLVSTVVEPTCQEEGVGIYKCSCGEQETLPIDKLEHKPVPYEEVAPSCGDGYTGGLYCSECLEVLEERQVIPGTGNHNVVNGSDVPASCTHTGLTNVKVCSVCHEIISSVEIPMLPHDYAYETIIAPAYHEDGLRHCTCKVCGHEEDQVIPGLEYDISKLWDGSVASSFAGGDGTVDDPYLISNASELAFLSSIYGDAVLCQSYYNCYFKLTDDIVMNDCAEYDTWTGSETNLNKWNPIATSYGFRGYFDGDGHTIFGVFMNQVTPKNSALTYYCGLFGNLYSGEISNLNIKNSFFKATNGNAGGLADTFSTNASLTINNCKVDAIIKADYTLGGIVGYCNSSSDWIATIKNCETRGTYTCTKLNTTDNHYGAGGIVGMYNNEKGGVSIDNCVNYADIESFHAGGIYGYRYSQYSKNTATNRITNCKNYGMIKGTVMAAGIAAYISLGNDGDRDSIKIQYCENYGSIRSTGGEAGGIAASLTDRSAYNSKNVLDTCFNAGDVSAIDNADYFTCAGGIAGRVVGSSQQPNNNMVIVSCFNIGKVNGYNYIGGIVGHTERVLIKGCENAGEVSGMQAVGGIAGELFWSSIQATFSVGTVKAETISSITLYNAEKCGSLVGWENNGGSYRGTNVYLKGISTLNGKATGPVGSREDTVANTLEKTAEYFKGNYALGSLFGDDYSLYKKPNEKINFAYPLVANFNNTFYERIFPVEA